MAKKKYDWDGGAVLEEHTKKKHSILKEYFRQYLITRCQLPQQEKFRLAVVDGFSGAGLYKCGTYGSPLIFVDVLANTTNEINLQRLNQGMKPIQIECLLILNDEIAAVIDQLQKNISPLVAGVKEESKNLFIETEFHSSPFEAIYPQIKQRLLSAKCSNVLFNLDQCGYSHVTPGTIRDIIGSWRSAEVILTFMISSMLTYLSPNKESSGVPLEPEAQSEIDRLLEDEELLNKPEWLGRAEKIVYTLYRNCATYVSPFSINNPSGWRYWLMHYASNYRARQVYNNVLHQDGAQQAHYGRSGLRMLSYNPQDEGQLYLFNKDSRKSAKESLHDDIPKLVAESGDTLSMEDFYATAYSETPAHSDDIHEMIIENPDMQVITDSGGERRHAHTIKAGDTLKLKSQKSMFFMFPDFSKSR